MSDSNDQFKVVFDKLRDILREHEGRLVVKSDKPGDYYLDTHSVDKHKRPVFFGAVGTRKNYVSYYLMPVYMYPEMLVSVSDGLRKHMQGKSCFNFTKVDEALFDELAQITRQGIERYKEAQLV